MTTKERQTKVYHADLRGLREDKYRWLEEHDQASTKWQRLRPQSEFYLFIHRDEQTQKRYSRFVKITDIFPISTTGIKTHRDHFVIAFDKETLKRRMRTFLDPNLPNEFVREALGLKDTGTWSLENARKAVQQDQDWNSRIVPCLFRPFDVRWLFYSSPVVDRGRQEVMRHMKRGNLGLIAPRQVLQKFRHAFVTNLITNFNNIDTAGRFGSGYVFPLYFYPDTSAEELFRKRTTVAEKKPNLGLQPIKALTRAFREETLPEDIFFYVYAILNARSYREKYEEFLRTDFPRIPFTMDINLFQKLAALGEQLVDLHLLRSSELDPPIARFQGESDNRVQTGKKGLRYDPNAQRVYINGEQYFEGVPPQVWEYMIGGYQVCHKWLKDRKDRCLTLEEIRTYCRIVTALSKTIAIQAEIDKLYPQVEKTLLPIQL